MLLQFVGISASNTRVRRLLAMSTLPLACLLAVGVTAPAATAAATRDANGGLGLGSSGGTAGGASGSQGAATGAGGSTTYASSTTTTSSSTAGSGVSGGAGSSTAGSSTAGSSTSGSGSTGSGSSGGQTDAGVLTLSGAQQASGDGITLTVAQFGQLSHLLQITGSAPPADVGTTINIEGAPNAAAATWSSATAVWSELATATVQANGTFSTVWIPTESTTWAVRAVLGTGLNASQDQPLSDTGGGGLPDAATATAVLTATGTVALPIFKPSTATLYGPGFWGRRTACGQVLRRATLGVANRTLPCGTLVAVYFRGRELSVPVIDRGPYANKASWDLTMATAKALHMTETAQVGTLAPAPPALIGSVRHGS